MERQIISQFIGSELGLYDNNSPDHKSVIADKVIDVTDLCRDSKQVIVKYANVVRGRLAQICNLYEPGKDLGMTVHYHISQMSIADLAHDEVFVSHARSWGAVPYLLAKEIFSNS
jgi:hypothetical protein